VFRDILYAARQLGRNRAFAFVAIVSLALGIGATVAVFSAVNGILWSPYPYQDADRMVIPFSSHQSDSGGRMFMSTVEFRDSVLKASLLDGGILWDNWFMTAQDGGLPESLRAGKLSPNSFSFLGVPPLLGRGFEGDAFNLKNEPALPVVLSYKYWRSHYAGSPDVLGRVMQLDQQNYTIVGVMPERFRFLESDIYVPLTKSGGPFFVMARTKRAVTREAAASELEALLRRGENKEVRVRLTSLRDDAVGNFTSVLGVLFGAVVMILVVGCVNVSILLVARGMGRRHELAVREAVGASSGRLLRQLLTESMVLALTGGLAGIAVGYGLLGAIRHFMPADLIPHDIQIGINLEAFGFATVIALVAGVSAGILPALQFSRSGFSARGNVAALGAQRAHSVLMLGQIAITVLLVAGAGAALRTFLHLTAAQLGYDPRHVVMLELDLADGAFKEWSERTAYYERLRAAISSIPGVESVAIIQDELPPAVPGRSGFEIPGRQISESESLVFQRVSSGYFSTLRIPMLRGRFWTSAEEARPAHVAVISETTARRYWPHDNPVGQRVRLASLKPFSIFQADSPGNDQWVEIIGVAGDVRNNGLREGALPAAYAPYTIMTSDGARFVIRTAGAQAAIVHAASQQIAAINGSQPISFTSTLEERLKAAGWARQEFVASLFLLCAGLALLLAAGGLYSVVDCTVSQRASEFAIRMALGASRTDILSAVFRAAGTSVAVGLTCGLGLTALLDRPIARWTESGLWNPESLTPAIVVLALAACCAMILPARRALSSDPMDALRASS
jgi:predicted permease